MRTSSADIVGPLDDPHSVPGCSGQEFLKVPDEGYIVPFSVEEMKANEVVSPEPKHTSNLPYFLGNSGKIGLTDMEDSFLEKKIYYHDTDCGGVVYYANYLKYLEEARTEFFTSRGIDLKALAETGVFFVVSRVEIDYRSPAHYQDTLAIFTRIERARPVALHFAQEIKKNEALVAEAKTTLVCVGRDLRPIPIPEEIGRRI